MSDHHTTRSFSSRTATFGVSFAALAVALAASPALAESSAAPDAGELLGAAGLQISIERSAQVDNPYWVPTANDGPQAFGNDVPVVSPVPEIVIAAPGTPTTARDPVNVTGVGQMIVDQQNGFIGLCTGTLVNPRMVLFAAHCVNSRAEGAYGQNSGGQPIGFGFGSNNNVGGASAFGGWLNGIAGGARYETNTGRFMYDVNYVSYNPLSLEPDAATFLYADIATTTLDTPAANVPTWALLFSQLPAVPITASLRSG